MGNISNDRKKLLLKIEKARLILGKDLKNGVINEADIFNLINKDSSYMLDRKRLHYKESVLRNIYNCPFLLCDQNISIELKKILPLFLDARFNMEKDYITYNYNHGYITEEEFKEQLEEFEFIYYKSSNDGKNILKTGKVLGIKKDEFKIK